MCAVVRGVVALVIVGLLVAIVVRTTTATSAAPVRETFANMELAAPPSPAAPPDAFVAACPPLLPLHFSRTYMQDVSHDPLHEVDNATFQRVYVDQLVSRQPQPSQPPPCVNPYHTRVVKPATKHTRMHDPHVHNASADIPPNHDESTLRRIPSNLAGVGDALAPTFATPLTSQYAYPFPQTVRNATTSETVTQSTPTTQVLPPPVERIRAALPERLNQLAYRLVPTAPPYALVTSCVARTCTLPNGTRYYVWRDVYYREGRTHGFQVEWTARTQTATSASKATLVYGYVLGNYLPSEPMGAHDDGIAAGAPNSLVFNNDTATPYPSLSAFQAEQVSQTYDEAQKRVVVRVPPTRPLPMVGSPADTPQRCTGQLRYNDSLERCAASHDEFGRPKASGLDSPFSSMHPRWR